MDERRSCFKIPRNKSFMKRDGTWEEMIWSDLEKMLNDLREHIEKLEKKDSDNGER